jgi:hypothetical protein
MAQRIFDKKRGVLSTSGATSATFDIAVPINTTIGFLSKIVVRETNSNIGAFKYSAGSISNDSGTVALDNTITTIAQLTNTGLNGISAIFTANSTNLRLTVTGIVSADIDWQYEIEVIIN